MNLTIKSFLLARILALCFTTVLRADDATFTAKEIQDDIELFEEVLKTYHPGIYRFQSEQQFDAKLGKYKSLSDKVYSLSDAFLLFSELAVEMKCGHTFVNPYNQSNAIKKRFIDNDDKLPLLIKRIENRFYVDVNLDPKSRAVRGDEILLINGKPIAEIYQQMLKYVASDGSNLAKRYHRLDMDGFSTKQWFDILLPLLIKPEKGAYVLTFRSFKDAHIIKENLVSLSASERKHALIKLKPEFSKSSGERWQFRILGSSTGYFKFHSFATFNMELDWKAFIKGGFKQLKENQAENLIIDIRGNGGGMYDVVELLYRHLSDRPFKISRYAQKVVYKTVLPHHRPHLGSWNPAVYDITNQIKSKIDGFYVLNPAQMKTTRPVQNSFSGNVFLLIDEANNSATSTMAYELKKAGLATLVGSTNGGNLKGTNGGQMFFLKLPNSGIEIDIPLIGYFADTDKPDAGIEPDNRTQQTFLDWYQGKDTVLDFTLSKIKAE